MCDANQANMTSLVLVRFSHYGVDGVTLSCSLHTEPRLARSSVELKNEAVSLDSGQPRFSFVLAGTNPDLDRRDYRREAVRRSPDYADYAEGRGQRSEVGGQRSEIGGRRSEVCRQ